MNIKNNIDKFKYYIRRYGIKKTTSKVIKRILHIKENRKTNQEQYKIWMENNKLTENMINTQINYKFEYAPKISVVVPMYNTNEVFFRELISSLKNQTYSNWELCLADGSENKNSKFLDIIKTDSRIVYKYLNDNKGISENTNEALKMTTGDYIGFLDHDDILSQNALFEVVKLINSKRNIDFIYTDEDKIDENYERFEPYFKPDFSPETLECNNYITHFVVISRKLYEKVGLLDSRFNGAQDFDYVLRCTENTNNIKHISKILYHWRVSKNSTANVADAKPYAYENGVKVIEEHLKRIGKKGYVEQGKEVPGIYKITFDAKINNELVSIIIPNKDNVKLLKQCIDSILNITTYKNYEILIIENNSIDKETFEFYDEIQKNKKIKVINFSKEYPNEKEFNYSKLINYGVKQAEGKYICQLNNDTKILTNNWLELFIGYAQNKEIGAVGARLYYSDKSIQHAGIIVGISGIAGNQLVNLPFGQHAYFGREAATRNCLAVTGACLFSRKDVYEEVGYMDEEKFKIAFNDVDFCLKLFDKGYRIVYNPYVEIIHFESKSRGYEYSKEKEIRFENESKNFKNIWEKYIQYDPYYNENFTRNSCNYDIKID